MWAAVFADDSIKVDVGSEVSGKAPIECLCSLSACFPNFIGLQSTLDDVGDRPVFPPSQAVGEVARSGATNGQLRFSHDILLCMRI